jgi:hypothetical protein
MPDLDRSLSESLQALDAKVAALQPQSPPIDRWRAEAAGALYHLQPPAKSPLIVCILGGTGTGKSTLVNRLLDANVSAASFRRTFTAGAVAIVGQQNSLDPRWLGLSHVQASVADLPVRGQTDALVVVQSNADILHRITLVDTPDLDGDQPAHHAQADRVFRWAQAVAFLVSPEKYQMTELLPYYRLARRYDLPAIFVMNKCQTAAMLEDYRAMLPPESALYAVARDDAGYEPPAAENLISLRAALGNMPEPKIAAGASMRVKDLLGRLRDQVISPLRDTRRDIDTAVAALRAMETPASGVDVNPITEQLQRRLQQRSVLYLIGPGRILDRVRQVPSMLVRLPRATWDMLMHGKSSDSSADQLPQVRDLPDFAKLLADQLIVVQSRLDDVLQAIPSGKKWLEPGSGWQSAKIDPNDAAKIAVEELTELKNWLEKRWNATPRDTILLLRLLRHLPGGEKLTQWTEAAPYLLAIIVATHHAFFGHIDLMILGGYSLATWLTERLSNEVASRARQANRQIATRFEKLAHAQIQKSTTWLESQSPRPHEITTLTTMADTLEESLTINHQSPITNP